MSHFSPTERTGGENDDRHRTPCNALSGILSRVGAASSIVDAEFIEAQ